MISAGLAAAPAVSRAADPENDELPLEVIRTFKPLKGHIQTVALSRDEKIIAAGGRQTDSLYLWDLDTGEERTRIKLDHDCYTFNAAFSANGKTIAWEDGGAGIVRVFEVSTGKMVRQFTFLKVDKKGANHHAYSAAFSASGKLFAFATVIGVGKGIDLWDVETGKLVRQFPHPFPNSCAISEDEKLIATQDTYGEIRVWDMKGKQLHTFRRAPTPAKAMAAFTLLAFSPDGKHLAAGGHLDDTVTVWNLASEKKVLEISLAGTNGIPSTAVFTRDGKWLGVGTAVRTTCGLQFYDLASGKKAGFLSSEGQFQEKSVQFTSKGGYLTAGGVEGVRLYGPRNGREKDIPFFVPIEGIEKQPEK
jgi:WD40 repeat protein